jgi:hypothetical protein
MCKYSERLIAWMDGELAENEAAEVEQHARACAACGECLSSYEAASREFAAYYSAATQARPTPRIDKFPRWVPIAAASVAAVALMLALAFVPRSPKRSPMVRQEAAISSPLYTSPAPESAAPTWPIAEDRYPPYRQQKATRVGHPRRPTKLESAKADWAMAEPAIQIAIPADAMFPPGAVPEGVTYIASVSLAADGTVLGLRLQP